MTKYPTAIRRLFKLLHKLSWHTQVGWISSGVLLKSLVSLFQTSGMYLGKRLMWIFVVKQDSVFLFFAL